MLRSQWPWLSWVLVGLVVVTGLLVGSFDDAGPRSDAERAADLAGTIRCPQCTGQSVAESDVAIARSIRADIAKRIDAGQSDAQIRGAYVETWGDSILLTPPGDGLVGLIWVIPVVAGALGVTALGFAFARWRGELAPADELDHASDADRSLVADALAGRHDSNPAS